MAKQILTFAELLKRARLLKAFRWDRDARRYFLEGLLNGAKNWGLPK